MHTTCVEAQSLFLQASDHLQLLCQDQTVAASGPGKKALAWGYCIQRWFPQLHLLFFLPSLWWRLWLCFISLEILCVLMFVYWKSYWMIHLGTKPGKLIIPKLLKWSHFRATMHLLHIRLQQFVCKVCLKQTKWNTIYSEWHYAV